MDDTKDTKPKTENVDEELSKLLDSALEDFSKQPKEEVKDEAVTVESTGGAEASAELLDVQKMMKEFETTMLPLLMNADNMSAEDKDTFKRMRETAQLVLTDAGDDSAAFASFLAEGLKAGQDDQLPQLPAEVMRAFQDPATDGSFMHFLQGMAQQVLRKDTIYPGVRHIADRYPAWLEENRANVTVEDGARYEQQLALMRQVCAVLEEERDTDGAEVRVRRMEQVVGLMQKLHELGDIPEDLMGSLELPPLPNVQGLPGLEGGENQCSLM